VLKISILPLKFPQIRVVQLQILHFRWTKISDNPKFRGGNCYPARCSRRHCLGLPEKKSNMLVEVLLRHIAHIGAAREAILFTTFRELRLTRV